MVAHSVQHTIVEVLIGPKNHFTDSLLLPCGGEWFNIKFVTNFQDNEQTCYKLNQYQCVIITSKGNYIQATSGLNGEALYVLYAA